MKDIFENLVNVGDSVVVAPPKGVLSSRDLLCIAIVERLTDKGITVRAKDRNGRQCIFNRSSFALLK